MKRKYRIYLTSHIGHPAMELLEGNSAFELEINRDGGSISWNSEIAYASKEELLTNIKGKDGLLCFWGYPIDSEIMDAADRLKVISVGNVVVDVPAAEDRGIVVVQRPYVDIERVADHTWALLLSGARRICECDQYVKKTGKASWSPMRFVGSDVFGKTLGIVGAGRIGYAVARRAVGFRMKILYSDIVANTALEMETKAQKVDLEELLRESDFISLHLPVPDAETKILIGEKELSEVRESAYLINTSRGKWIDENALVRVLKEGKLRGAALDVFAKEPDLANGINALPNVVLTPHRGSTTIEAREEMGLGMAKGLLDVLL